MSVDAKDAAFFAQLVVPKIIHGVRLSRIRVAFNQGDPAHLARDDRRDARATL